MARAACANVGVVGVVGSLSSQQPPVCVVKLVPACVVNQFVFVIGHRSPERSRHAQTRSDGGCPSALPQNPAGDDTTMVSPLSREGAPHARCAEVDGAATEAARRRKERRARSFGGVGLRVGGRFSEECRRPPAPFKSQKVRIGPPSPQQRLGSGGQRKRNGTKKMKPGTEQFLLCVRFSAPGRRGPKPQKKDLEGWRRAQHFALPPQFSRRPKAILCTVDTCPSAEDTASSHQGPGLETTAREPERALKGPGIQKHQISTRRPPREESEILGCPGRRGVRTEG